MRESGEAYGEWSLSRWAAVAPTAGEHAIVLVAILAVGWAHSPASRLSPPACEKHRPIQRDLSDRKTGERVAILFCFRGQAIPTEYFNRALIPLLCRKAVVPRRDARGRITSHRARATIAMQLFNAQELMSLFEFQAWLGHRSPISTQHYAKITPTTLTNACHDDDTSRATSALSKS